MYDLSGFGLKATIVALQTFPMGFQVSDFADDVNPLEISDDEVAAYEMLYDGSLYAFTKAFPITVKISVIPGSDDDINLKILLAAKKVTSHLFPISDLTSMVVSYPDGGKAIFSNGTILSGPPADSITLGGRKKGNTFTFVFGAVGGAQSSRQIAASAVQFGLGLL